MSDRTSQPPGSSDEPRPILHTSQKPENPGASDFSARCGGWGGDLCIVVLLLLFFGTVLTRTRKKENQLTYQLIQPQTFIIRFGGWEDEGSRI